MPRTTPHIITVPVAVATSRMPALVRAGADDVVLRRETATSWSFSGGGGGGTVALSALSPAWTSLRITTDADADTATADALAVALYATLERHWAPPPPGAAGGPRPATKFALAAVVVLVPLLAVTGLRMLSPPAPLDVASAVTQFRQAAQTPPATPTTTPSDQGRQRQRGSAAAADRSADGGTSAPAGPAPRRGATTATAQSAHTEAGDPKRQRGRTTAQRANAGTRSAGQPDQYQRRERRQPAATTPQEGVYRYATNGYESIDRPSARHDYPRETATTIRAGGCGFTVRWQPLENRWDEMSICRNDSGAFMERMATHREFYGQANDTQFQCERNVYAWRTQAGATWTGTCSDGDAVMQLRGQTLGREDVRVGDETINALRFVIEGRISGGEAQGTWKAERWIHPDTGLVLRLEAQTRATSDSSVGPVQYTENLSLRLLSTTPQR